MFGKLMNNYYYGKSGKGDFRKEDMPETRWQLFWDMLRTRLSALCRLNLLYMLIFIPTFVVLGIGMLNMYSNLSVVLAAQEGRLPEMLAEQAESSGTQVTITEEEIAKLAETNPVDLIDNTLFSMLLWLIPCLAITGPFTAGLSYVTRNWARDEHAFIWSDFKDAVKANWKQALGLSVITSVLPIAAYVSWRFYGNLAQTNMIMIVPQILVVLLVIIWALSITYMHPIVVTYDLKFSGVIRNGLLLGVARLPFSVGIRLLHCVPGLIGFLIAYFWNPMYGILFLGGWYMLIGFSLSRFVTASYTNAVFDKYINSRIEGAQVNRGLREDEEDDGDDGEETEE